MFGKLMNHELRYLTRKFVPMWAVVLTLCCLMRLSLGISEDGYAYMSGDAGLISVLLVMTTMFSLFATGIVTVVVTLERFYKGVFGEEGYLLFTLPVTTGQIIHAKAISAVLMTVITAAVTFLGVLIISAHEEVWSMSDAMYGTFMYTYDISPVSVALVLFWGIVVVIATVAQGLYEVYLAMTIGQLWKKHPVAGAILAFYGVQMVVRGIGLAVSEITGDSLVFLIQNAAAELNGAMTLQIVAVMAYLIIKALILSTIYFFATKLILDKKLELQ